MKNLARLCGAFVLVLLLAGGAQAAQVVELSLNLVTPPGHVRNEYLIRPWIKLVEEKSGGTLKITPYYAASMAPVAQAYEAAVTGIADLSEGLIYSTPGVFPLTEIVMLPGLGLGSSAIPYGENMWKAYKAVPEMAAEWKATKVLWLTSSPPTVFLMRTKPVHTVDDLKGMKIRISSAISTRVAEQLGFVPISLPIGEVYQAMEKGVIDGSLLSYELLPARRLGEVTKSITHVPLVTDAFFMVMNKDTWNSLSAEHKAVIDSVSGDFAVAWAGKVWDDNDRRGAEAFPNLEYIRPSPAEMKRFEDKLVQIKFDYAADLEKKGLPARRVLDIIMGK